MTAKRSPVAALVKPSRLPGALATQAKPLNNDLPTSWRWVDVLTIYLVVGTVVGARLGHVFFYEPDLLLQDPLEVFRIWHGGLASHGATLSIPLTCWLFARKYQFDTLWVLDRLVLVVGLGGACIRLGNFMNSEIGGYPTTVPWAVVFGVALE